MSEQEAVKPCDMFSPVIGMCGLPMGHEGDHAKAIEAPKTPLSAAEVRELRELPPKSSLMINPDEPKKPIEITASGTITNSHIPTPCLSISNQSEIVSILKESRNLQLAVAEAIHYQVREGSAEALDKAIKLIEYLKKINAESAGRAK